MKYVFIGLEKVTERCCTTNEVIVQREGLANTIVRVKKRN